MNFRKATISDLPGIIGLLANDPLGKLREDLQDPLPSTYTAAFQEIDKDPNQELLVVEDESGELMGTFQLTYIQYLNYQGGARAQIESVRVREDLRGKGMGRKMFEWAIVHVKKRGVRMLQLTSDKQRPEAIRFYESLGFKVSHEGFKLHF